MKSYYLPILVLMACAVNAYAQKSNPQTVSLGVDKSKKPEKEHGPDFANRNLSNLLQTSINVDLLPDANKRNLGSLNHPWKNLYLTGSIYLDGKRFLSNKGVGNTFIGGLAGINNTSGAGNTAIGFQAFLNNTTGFQNVAIGLDALQNNTTGNNNNAVGVFALLYNTSGTNNCAFGSAALLLNSTGSSNTAFGNGSLVQNLDGNFNTAFGDLSLANNTASGNTAVGKSCLYSNTVGLGNTGVGYNALTHNSLGFFNTAIGFNALFSNTEGYDNIAIGTSSMINNTVGTLNSVLGNFALYANTTGNYNTAIGYSALTDVIGGSRNTALGMGAGIFRNNFSLGTLLGAETNANDNLSNFTAVGYGAYALENNQVVVGNTSVTSIGGYANWSNFSDGRYKSNIQEDVPGLNFITQLRPVTYTLNIDGIEQTIKAAIPEVNRTFEIPSLNGLKLPHDISSAQKLKSEPTDQEIKARQDKAKVVYTGFVAQEVEKLAKEINYDFSGVDAPKNEKGFYSLRYGDFVVPLVKAVQELNKKNEELEQRIQKLEALLLNNEESMLNNKADKKGNETIYLSSARLEQNNPNPSRTSTTIRYFLPNEISGASIVISDMKGKTIKTISLNAKGIGQININTGLLASGTYSYTLLVDGKKVDTRLMVVGK